MHLANALAISLASLPTLINAHGILAPKLIGRSSIEELKARNAFALKPRAPEPQPAPVPAPKAAPLSRLQERANTDGQCGQGFGSCAPGYCCSSAGWCGNDPDYCSAPDCQFNYGTGCDTLKVPPGPKTSNVARTKVGSVPYGGAGVYNCVTKGHVAITYDDGPYVYTANVLDLFDRYNAKATFFITGNNLGKGEIDNAAYPWASYIQRMHASGHQIASHTWGHQDLSRECTSAQRKTQMYNNEIAFNNILGFFPTYMRPPYSSCDATSNGNCQSDLAALGYHVIYFDLDTEDYLLTEPNLIQQAKNDFSGNLSTTTPQQGSKLGIAHDIHFQTSYNLTEFMLRTLTDAGFKAVTVGECLGDPKANWYRTLGGGAVYTSGTNTLSFPSSTATTIGTRVGSSVSTSTTATPSSVVSNKPSGTSSASVISNKPSGTLSASGTSSASGPTSTKVVTTDATCGGANGYTCLNSSFGNCCSVNGWCGSTEAYCGTGCQSSFGTCGSNTTPSQSSQPASPSSSGGSKPISDDGSCGGTKGFTCQGSEFGNCCSEYGWCGSLPDYCGASCNPLFGTCTSSGPSTVIRVVSSSSIVGQSSAVPSPASSPARSASVNPPSSSAVRSSVVNPASSSVIRSSVVNPPSSSVVRSSAAPASSSVRPVSSSMRPSSSALVSSSIRMSSSLRSSVTAAPSSSARPSSSSRPTSSTACKFIWWGICFN